MRDTRPAPPRYPVPMKMAAGETRYWCGCRHSDDHPFCNDPACPAEVRIPYTAPRDEIALFCGCHATSTAPICDGTHAGLRQRQPWWVHLKAWCRSEKP